MLNGIFREQNLALSVFAGQACLERGADDIIEQESSVNKQHKASNLEPFERLPAQAEGNEPNEKCTASVNRAARCSRDSAGNRQTKEVEATREKLDDTSIDRQNPEINIPDADHDQHT